MDVYFSMTQFGNYYNADDGKGRDYICSAEGASTLCESLRQKNSCLTQLWRVLTIREQPPKGKANCR